VAAFFDSRPVTDNVTAAPIVAPIAIPQVSVQIIFVVSEPAGKRHNHQTIKIPASPASVKMIATAVGVMNSRLE